MFKRYKKNSHLALVIAFACLGSVYLLFMARCFGSCDTTIIKPLFVSILGLIPTLIMLVFFSDKIFISWVKRIAWWFVLIVAILVKSNDHESDYSFFGDDVTVIGLMMTILFVITLIYAFGAKKKLRDTL